MPRQLTEAERDTLEALVDASTLNEVVTVLATIASLKAEHLLSNWQDAPSGKPWNKASYILDGAAGRITV